MSAYAFEIYLDRPSRVRPERRRIDAFLPSKWWKKPEPKYHTCHTGHLFIALVKPDGSREVWGYGAVGAMVHDDGTRPSNEPMNWRHKMQAILSTTPAAVVTESLRRYDDKRVYTINAAQYAAMRAKVAEWQKNPPGYHLYHNNCLDFAFVVGRAGGIKLPFLWRITKLPLLIWWDMTRPKIFRKPAPANTQKPARPVDYPASPKRSCAHPSASGQCRKFVPYTRFGKPGSRPIAAPTL